LNVILYSMRESGPEHAGAAIIFSRPPVTFLATKHHRPLTATKLYCFVTEASHSVRTTCRCSLHWKWNDVAVETATSWTQV